VPEKIATHQIVVVRQRAEFGLDAFQTAAVKPAIQLDPKYISRQGCRQPVGGVAAMLFHKPLQQGQDESTVAEGRLEHLRLDR
jgi:hypothetical protein